MKGAHTHLPTHFFTYDGDSFSTTYTVDNHMVGSGVSFLDIQELSLPVLTSLLLGQPPIYRIAKHGLFLAGKTSPPSGIPSNSQEPSSPAAELFI